MKMTRDTTLFRKKSHRSGSGASSTTAVAALVVFFFVCGGVSAGSSADNNIGGSSASSSSYHSHSHAHNHKHVVSKSSILPPHSSSSSASVSSSSSSSSENDMKNEKKKFQHQQQQQQQQQQHFSGPLGPGLSVTGGSKLRRTTQRLRKFREVRASSRNNLPASERVPHDELPTRQDLHRHHHRSSSSTQPYNYFDNEGPQQDGAVQQQQQQQIQHHSSSTTTTKQHQEQQQRMMMTSPEEQQQQEQEPMEIRYETYIVPPPPSRLLEQQQQQKQLPQEQQQQDQTSNKTSSNSKRMALVYMSLLAVQFGIQPLLVSKFAPRGIIKSSVVLTQELFKFVIALVAYKHSTTIQQRSIQLSSLNVKKWLTMAGIPAGLYTVQNLASLMAYQNLEALTFNVLNQTKILTSALCCYLIMGKKQSTIQSLSLLLLVLSALVIEKIVSFQSIIVANRGILSFVLGTGGTTTTTSTAAFSGFSSLMSSRRFTHGIIPVLLASLISGLAGALTQKNLQGVVSHTSKSNNKSSSLIINKNRKTATSAVATTTTSSITAQPKNAYLFSMELTAASVAVLLLSLFVTADGKRIVENGFFDGWTPKVLIPILTNSIGGILVGLVTKHAGSVKKGFALIFGLLLSGFIQALWGSSGVTQAQIVGGMLAGISLWLHSSYPSKSK